MDEPSDPADPPESELHADDLEEVQFDTTFRGFDQSQVNELLASAAGALRAAEGRQAELGDELLRYRATIEAEASGEDESPQASESPAERELARQEGRAMVAEAELVRERMLADLARRRKAARRELETLRAGRERLLVAFAAVGKALSDMTAELTTALPAARIAADRAGRAFDRDEPEDTVEQLEASLEAGRLADLPILDPETGPLREPAPMPSSRDRWAGPPERDVRDMPEVERVVAAFEEVRVLEGQEGPEPGDETGEGPSGASATTGEAGDSGEAGGVPVDDAEADPPVDPEPDHEPADAVGGLVARLRGEASEPAPDPGTGDADGETSTASAARTDLESADRRDEPVPPMDPVDLDDEWERTVGSGPDTRPAGDPAEDLAQRLRAVLADEENQALDRLRRRKSRPAPSPDELLGPLEGRVARLEEVIVVGVTEAVGDPAAAATAVAVAERVAGDIHEAVGRVVAESDDDGEIATGIRASFREWKTPRLAEATREALTANRRR